MRNQILVSVAIATLILGIAIPLSQRVYAPSTNLEFIGVNKLNSDENTGCENMVNIATKVGGSGVGPLGVVNCNTAPTDGTTYSRNTVQPHLLIAKSNLQNNDQVTIRLHDLGDEESLRDIYTYTVHDIDTISEVQIRLCDGAITDHICNTRIVSES